MTTTTKEPRQLPALLRPLSEKTYRTIWLCSLLSNFGQLIQGVGAAWEMTRLTPNVQMVALVQTAIMLPLMLFGLPAGAIADMYDRRKVALAGLSFALISAATLTTLAWFHLISPWVLLAFCFIIGTGMAFFGPAWQASVSEQVSAQNLPSAVALSSVSYNVARSFGPALGGLIVAAAGSVFAFGINALFYVPIIIAFYSWRRVHAPSRLPPERIDRAMLAGMRYAVHSPPIRVVLIRTLLTALAGASVSALTPLVAKNLLGGGASTYGLLLGAFGVGAVGGATFIGRVRKMDAESAVRRLAMTTGAMIVIVGLSHILVLSIAALMVAGAAWTLINAMFNVGVQLSAPRWVTGRAVSCWSASVTGGIAFGAVGWGRAAAEMGTGTALIIAGAVLAATAVIGIWLPMPTVAAAEEQMAELRAEPEIGMALTLRSGPIVIEIDYHVAADEAREFYAVMQDVRRGRLRSGAFEWSLSRDLADPGLWTERYHCPTWGDYLRQRNRATQSDQEAGARALAFDHSEIGPKVRRRLERPFGSVRWQADTPDMGETTAIFTPV